MLPSLRRRGIVESWKEHSPGSIVVKLAPMSTLLATAKRRRDAPGVSTQAEGASVLHGLDPQTIRMLRQLAVRYLESLGVMEPEHYLDNEMTRTFSALIAAIPEGPNREGELQAALRKAIDEASEQN